MGRHSSPKGVFHMRKFVLGTVLAALFSIAAAQLPSAFPQTASYGVFPINNSGVSGYVQMTEEMGHTRVTVTLSNIVRGSEYLPVLFEGTCGPDRDMVLALNPVGSFVNDPFVSLDEITLSVNQIEQSQYFMYIFTGSELPPLNENGNLSIDSAVACGQIGLGANR